MPLPLVFTVPKYIDTNSKNPLFLDPTAKTWWKIALQVLSKNIVIATGFIIVSAVLKSEAAVSNTSKLISASRIKHNS